MDKDGFQIVRRKRNKSKHICHTSSPSARLQMLARDAALEQINIDKVTKKIIDAKHDVRQSDFYCCFMSTLKQSFESLMDKTHQNHTSNSIQPLSSNSSNAKEPSCKSVLDSIVCYGLGNFSTCMIARYQLALLLCLQNDLQPLKVHAFDPVFLPLEADILNTFDISVLSENEEGKRTVQTRTLFYLPHCGKALYNNLLWANWGLQLTHVIVIGNSFTHIYETVTNGTLKAKWFYLLRALAHVEEFGVVNCFQYQDIFNNMSVHVFPVRKVICFPSEYWQECQEPVYSDSDVEIITNKMMKHLSTNASCIT